MKQPDFLEMAKTNLELITGAQCTTSEQMSLFAIAAALIAGLEQRPRFVQIGQMAYNLDQIQIVNMRKGSVRLWFVDHSEHDGPTELEGPEATAFLAWWNSHADVVRLDVEED